LSRREAFPRMPRMLRDAYTIDEAFDEPAQQVMREVAA